MVERIPDELTYEEKIAQMTPDELRRELELGNRLLAQEGVTTPFIQLYTRVQTFGSGIEGKRTAQGQILLTGANMFAAITHHQEDLRTSPLPRFYNLLEISSNLAMAFEALSGTIEGFDVGKDVPETLLENPQKSLQTGT